MSALVLRYCVQCGQSFEVYSKTQRHCSKACSGPSYAIAAANPQRIAERFWRRVDKDGPVPAHRPELGPCWIWTGTKTLKPKSGSGSYGYGQFGINGKVQKAHRYAWFLKHGRWPDPCALHKCDNPSCVRASHLFEGTKSDNMADMVAKGRARPVRGPRPWARCVVGEAHGRHKFTEAEVLAVLEGVKHDKQAVVARRMGISTTHVNAIVHGRVRTRG